MENYEEHVDDNEVLFFEHRAAAQSLRSVWTRLASTDSLKMFGQNIRIFAYRKFWCFSDILIAD